MGFNVQSRSKQLYFPKLAIKNLPFNVEIPIGSNIKPVVCYPISTQRLERVCFDSDFESCCTNIPPVGGREAVGPLIFILHIPIEIFDAETDFSISLNRHVICGQWSDAKGQKLIIRFMRAPFLNKAMILCVKLFFINYFLIKGITQDL